MSVKVARGLEEILSVSRDEPHRLQVLSFVAKWVESCMHMDEVIEALASAHPEVIFWRVDAETVADAALHFCIEAVPTFVLLRAGKEVQRVNGAQAEVLAGAISEHNPESDPTTRLRSLVNRHKLMIFIKGTPQSPRCGFTRQLLDLFSQQGIEDFDHFDILQDEEVRQGLKAYSEWPTYPQIYLKGELLGGLDILKELAQSGQLIELLN